MTAGGSSNSPRPSKNERRQAAREKARALREEQRKRERRNKFFLQGGIGIAVLAVIALVVLVIVNTVKPAGPGPANMASDGIVLGEGLTPVTTPALQPDQSPIPTEPDASGKVVDIRMYVDYMCPLCGQFERTNAEQIKGMLERGAATLEVHPISILDRVAMGSKYSSRAANAAACVANYSPDSFWNFNSLMMENQPEEGTTGLSDDEIAKLAVQADVERESAVTECIKDFKFKSWVDASTQRALSGPIPNSEVESVTGTPTVLVNGKQYVGSLTDPKEFAAFVLSVAADAFSTSTPTPTPEPAPAG